MLLHGGAVPLLPLIAALLLRDHGRRLDARLAAALAIGGLAFTLISTPGVMHTKTAWHAPLMAISVANPFVFWLLSRALLTDDFALRPWHWLVWGLLAAKGAVLCLVQLDTSHDTAGRRFPSVMAATFEPPAATAFLPHSPLWCRLGAQVRLAQAAEDFAVVQSSLAHQPLQVELDEEASGARSDFFLQQFSMARLESVLSSPELRQTLLALGLLLRPVLSRGPAGIDRSLVLPLSRDPTPRPHVLSFWVDLVSGFFKSTPVEIALFITTHGEQPVLVLGFHGASPATPRSVIDPEACRERNVAVTQAAWVEECSVRTMACVPCRTACATARSRWPRPASCSARPSSTLFLTEQSLTPGKASVLGGAPGAGAQREAVRPAACSTGRCELAGVGAVVPGDGEAAEAGR